MKQPFPSIFGTFSTSFTLTPLPSNSEDEPPLLSGILNDDGRADAYLAATAEFLSRKYSFSRPGWTQADQRILHAPFFALDSHAARMWLLVESPAPFRERNIFISADALSRV